MGQVITSSTIESARSAAQRDGVISPDERANIAQLAADRDSQQAFGEEWLDATKMPAWRSAAPTVAAGTALLTGMGLVAWAAPGRGFGLAVGVAGAFFASQGVAALTQNGWKDRTREEGAEVYAEQGPRVARERLEARRF